MPKITLVCSVHAGNGLCNAEELLKILRAIEPEVVFEEVRSSDFDSYYKTKRSLEAQAITKYREHKFLRQVPVDQFDMPENLAETKREFDRVFDRVDETSQEYLALGKIKDEDACQYGFKYLNSIAFARITARISEIEAKTIIETGDQGLIRGLEKWRHFISKRDVAMIDNIYEYCRQHVFDTGVFLVGAAHKTGIVKEIEKHAATESDLIDWNFTY
jgi:hypothetical protein